MSGRHFFVLKASLKLWFDKFNAFSCTFPWKIHEIHDFRYLRRPGMAAPRSALKDASRTTRRTSERCVFAVRYGFRPITAPRYRRRVVRIDLYRYLTVGLGTSQKQSRYLTWMVMAKWNETTWRFHMFGPFVIGFCIQNIDIHTRPSSDA